jgi:DNA-binding FadR family transcriptional regulator
MLHNGFRMTPSADNGRAILRPVLKRPLSEQVFDRLREAIVSGQLPPGSVLPSERKLRDSLKVSRGAVREALKRLEQSRFIEIQHGEATRVLDFWESARLDILSNLLVTPEGGFDLHVAQSVIQLRAAITPDMVRLAAERHGADLAPVLLPLLDEMRAHSRDPIRAQELSEQFWRIVVRASENVAYVLVLNTMNEAYERIKKQLTPLLATSYQDVSSFEAMVDAIVSSNVEAAQRAAVRHVARIADALASEIGALQAEGATAWRPLRLRR